MSIIAHLVQVTTQQLRLFKSNPEEAYALILGSSKPAVKNAAQEIAAWKFRNAGTLLQVIRAGGRVENLNPVEKLAFEKAHSQHFQHVLGVAVGLEGHHEGIRIAHQGSVPLQARYHLVLEPSVQYMVQ